MNMTIRDFKLKPGVLPNQEFFDNLSYLIQIFYSRLEGKNSRIVKNRAIGDGS